MSSKRGVIQTDLTKVAIRIRLRGEGSSGQLAVIEEVVPAGFGGPPLHVHPSFDEGFYVLEGELTFRMEDELVSGGAGTFAFAPRGTRHTFANLSGQDARLLIMCTPAGFEHYFERLAAEQAGIEPPPERPNVEQETQVVGPRIGVALAPRGEAGT